MKKTFTINISGIIFHIDEDAYDKLNAYLESIKISFRGSAGKEEIIADIESRIAELLQEKLSDVKQVINLEDVDQVIALMGQPSDFAEEDEGESTSAESEPKTYYSARRPKRLFRDTDNKMLGGVCSGIGIYFNIDPLWARLLFVVLAIATGIGILAYLILWIVVPEAATTAEKLEMRGEPINVSNIEKSIRKEVDKLKDTINDLTDEAKSTFKKKSSDLRRSSDPVASFLRGAIKVFLRIIVIFIGIILTIIAFSFIIAILASAFSFGGLVIFNDVEFGTLPLYEFLNMIAMDPSNIAMIQISLLIVFGLPVMMLLIAGIRLIFGLRGSRVMGATAFYIWIIGLVMLVIFSIRVGKDFRYEEVAVKNIQLPTHYDNIYLSLNKNLELDSYYDEEHYVEIYEWDMVLTDVDKIFYGMPELKIVKSDNDLLELSLYSRARGSNKLIAMERAEGIEYPLMLQDSSLAFNTYFTLEDGELWRAQELDVELKVPVGMVVHIGDQMHQVLGYHRHYSRYSMSGESFIMTEKGLKSLKEPAVEVEDISSAPVYPFFSPDFLFSLIMII